MSTEFRLAPYSVKKFTIIAVLLGILLVALVGTFGYFSIGLNNIGLAVNGDSLELTGFLYGRTIPKSHLKLDQAKVVSVDKTDTLQGMKRESGVGLSDLEYGWFKLKNGDKALVAISDRNHAVVIPTTEDFTLVVSPKDPEAFLAALRK